MWPRICSRSSNTWAVGSLAVIDGSGHYPQVDAVGQTTEVILPFLKEHHA